MPSQPRSGEIPFVESSFSQNPQVEEYGNAKYRDLEEFDIVKAGFSTM
jgi:hypothetical protein